ncbi:MAG: hypothetical protein DHS20C10_12550 [marine bacterium B5-7]|nr:MAG: hypothetical protein DHS20C10_12550 [marine bacterium B5-7]
MSQLKPLTDAEKRIEARPLNLVWMSILAMSVGMIGGFGSIIFRDMIGLVHNIFFFGKFSFAYDSNIHTDPSTWGAFIILIPVVGGVIVTWLVKTFAPEAKGHGVPEVMNAVHYQNGLIRPIVAIVKSIASSISIGSGGSVGREGPIIQIGSAFGSTLGQIIKMPVRQRVVLIAAGAAAGIAATFNAPMGGVTFAVELLLISINAGNVMLITLATVTATYISHLFAGMEPSFSIPNFTYAKPHLYAMPVLFSFIPFGVIMGFAATLYVKSIYWAEDTFDDAIKNPYLRHMVGMLMLGITIYGFMRFSGHYYVQGVGYAAIMDILKESLMNPWFLLLLFAAKLLVTSLTLGSGASGGIFSPSLFLGATLGGAFGLFIQFLFPAYHVIPIYFSIAGMAAMVSGSTGAVVTAIVMTFEQTRDYNSMLPIILTAGLSYGIRIWLCRESIYTLKLRRRGFSLPQGLQAAIMESKQAADIMSDKFKVVAESEWRQSVPDLQHYVLAEADEEIVGRVMPDNHLDRHFVVVDRGTYVDHILREMHLHDASVAFVTTTHNSRRVQDITGVITIRELVDAEVEMAMLMH